MRVPKGFTLIEILVALAIGGMVFALLMNAVITTGRHSRTQVQRNQAQEDLRLLFLRLNEVGASAAYIYPENLGFALPDGRTVTTRRRTLAFLVPWGSTYCQGPSGHERDYCAFLYFWDNRARYRSVLGGNPTASNRVLVELKVTWVTWPVNTLPPRNFSGSSWNSEISIVLDSLDRNHTDLTNDLRLAEFEGVDNQLYKKGDSMSDGKPCNRTNRCHKDPRALIRAVRPRIAIALSNGRYVQRTEWIVPKLIPRAAEPGVAQQ